MATDYDVKVTLKPDTKELEKELKKKRTANVGGVTGVATGKAGGSGGIASFLGMEAALDQIKDDTSDSKNTEKKSLTGIGKLIGIASLIGLTISALSDMFRPIIDLLKAAIVLLFLPMYRAGMIPLIKALGKWVGNVAAAGGGVTGVVKGTEASFEEAFEGMNGAARLFTAVLAGLIAVFAVIIIGILGFGIMIGAAVGLIIAAVVAIVVILILSWDKIVAFFGVVLQAWKDFISDIKEAWRITVDWISTLGKRIWNAIKSGLSFVANLGVKIWDFIKVALSSIADLGTRIWNFLKNALSSIANLGSRIWGAIKGGLGKLFGFGKRATGGPVSASTPYLVGERGPELFVPGSSGRVVSNNQLGGASQPISISTTLNINGPISSDVDVRSIAEQVVEHQREEMSRRSSYSRN